MMSDDLSGSTWKHLPPGLPPCMQMEGQRAEVARHEAERNALSKLDKIRVDQVRVRV